MEMKEQIIKWALDQGFIAIGFSSAKKVPDQSFLEKWLKQGMHGQMSWMIRHMELRKNPNNVLPGVKTIISAAICYSLNSNNNRNPQIASYAQYQDYHQALKHYLGILLHKIKKEYSSKLNQKIHGRVVVDSAPLDEKKWATQAGIGFIGKNTLLINPQFGSRILLGEILINIAIEPDTPIAGYCKDCDKCIRACPTGALTPYQLDAPKCLAYQTVEMKMKEDNSQAEMDASQKQKKIDNNNNNNETNWIFGCDLCLKACPYNKQKTKNQCEMLEKLIADNYSWQELQAINTKEEYMRYFAHTPLMRISLQKMQHNLNLAKNKQ